MPSFEVQRATVIDVAPERAFDAVADYGTWTNWSPWLTVDPDAEVVVSDDPRSIGSTYRWKGELVGEGEIEHRALERPSRIDQELRFVKPFRSVSQVGFDFVPDGDGTRVTWRMRGSLPWFLFWMKSNMETLVGLDYERGLGMLKEFVETGTVRSKTEVMGVEAVDPLTLYGIRRSCSFEEVGTVMEQAMTEAIEAAGDQGLPTDGLRLSLYHDTNLKKRRFEFTTGLGCDSDQPARPPLSRIDVRAQRALHVRHTGSYEHLGNAWSGAYQVARHRKLRLAKADGIEIYQNLPSEAPPWELVADIYLPLK